MIFCYCLLDTLRPPESESAIPQSLRVIMIKIAACRGGNVTLNLSYCLVILTTTVTITTLLKKLLLSMFFILFILQIYILLKLFIGWKTTSDSKNTYNISFPFFYQPQS